MNISMSVFRNRLLPLFDSCQRILLINWDGEKELSREMIYITNESPLNRVETLIKMNTGVLICGAISKFLMRQIISSSIKVIPNLSGEFEEILTAFKNNSLLHEERFLMPGCCNRRRRRCKKGGIGSKSVFYD